MDPKRLRDVLAKPKPLFRDRDEEEVRGYREALSLIHDDFAAIEISEETVRRLHRLTRGEIWDAGKYKENESDIIERLPRRTAAGAFSHGARKRDRRGIWRPWCADWQRCLKERWVHPLVALACFNLDFLCIHPFRDGNGRASRGYCCFFSATISAMRSGGTSAWSG